MEDIISTFLAAAAGEPAAPGSGGQGQNPMRGLLQTMGPLLFMVVIFYFLLIRPQNKKAREHAEMLKTLRPGDRVVTSSGIVATVLTVKEKTVSLRSADAKLEVLKSAVSDITERGGDTSQG